jgi:ABC-type nitrate/sulfonate/bicarbonate transport system permease component
VARANSLARYRILIGAGAIVALILAWQLVSVYTDAGRLTGSPLQIVRAVPGVIDAGLLAQSLFSLQALVYGLVIAIVAGVALGVLLGSIRSLAYLFEPALMALYVTPTVALLPLIVIWCGVGSASTTVIVSLSAVFPILVNTMAGVRQLDPQWTRAVTAFGGSRLMAFRLVAIQGSLPEILLGIRLGIGRGLIGIIVAEMYASSQGIGSLLNAYSHAVRIPELFVVVIVIGTFGFAVVQGTRTLEDRAAAWRL